LSELLAVKCEDIGREFEALRVPNFPTRMLHPIFAATSSDACVTPIMFGDEFSVRAGRNNLRFAARAHLERFPFRSASPGIFHIQSKIDMFDVVLHRNCEIRLAVKCARDKCDRAFGYEFAHEDDAASPRVRGFLSHVKAKIHFLEIAVQRDAQPEKASVEKEKSDDADKAFAIFEIDLGAGRDERRYDSRIDHVIEHGEITPARSEKWFHARKFVDSTESCPTYRDQCRRFSSDGSGAVPSEVAFA
jgi:hypothetical protein